MSGVQVIRVESKVLIRDKQDLNIEMIGLGSGKNRIQEEKSRIHIRDE